MPKLKWEDFVILKGINVEELGEKEKWDLMLGLHKYENGNQMLLWEEFGDAGLQFFTVPELQSELKIRELKVSGTKPILIQRLTDALLTEKEEKEKKRKAFEDAKNESPTKKQKDSTEEFNYILKMILTSHGCIRTLSVPGNMNFQDALEEMLDSFGFDLTHLYSIPLRNGSTLINEWEKGTRDRGDKKKVTFGDTPVKQLGFQIGDSMLMVKEFIN